MRNILLFLIILIVVGCTSHAAYTVFQPVPIENWTLKDTVKIQFDAIQPQGQYALNICVRTTAVYRNQQMTLPLQVTHKWEHLNDRCTDSITIVLADNTGHRMGDGINHRDIVANLTTLHLPDTLSGCIAIIPYPNDTIQGISHVGVQLIPTEERARR